MCEIDLLMIAKSCRIVLNYNYSCVIMSETATPTLQLENRDVGCLILCGGKGQHSELCEVEEVQFAALSAL